MDHKRIALYVQMLAFRTGRAWPEAIRALEAQGFVSQQWGVEGHVETSAFASMLKLVENEYLAFVATHPDLAPLALPADQPPGTMPPHRFKP